MNFRKNVNSDPVTFQMAPMIDVIFLLLLFFMVASVWAQWERQIGITLPTSTTSIQKQRTPGEIIVNLDDEGRIFVNEVERTPGQLQMLLAHVAKQWAGQPVIVRADRGTRYETIIQVLDICRQVDVWNVSFATLPPKDKEGA